MNTAIAERPLFLSPENYTPREQSVDYKQVSTSFEDYNPFLIEPKSISKAFLVSIVGDEGRIELKNPLPLDITRIDGASVVTNIDFNLSGEGNDLDEAINNFMDFFVHDYLVFSQEASENLTTEAKKLQTLYRSSVSSYALST